KAYSLFRVIPLPYENLTILPPLPYLILGEDGHTWINNELPRLEHTYLSNDILDTSNHCIIDISRRRPNVTCHAVPAHQTETTVQTLPNGQILIIATMPVEVREKCSNLEVKVLHDISIITPKPNCMLWINEEQFYMTPVVLPDSVTYLLPEPLMESSRSSVYLDNVPTTKLEELHQQLRNIKHIALQAPDLDPMSHSWITLYIVLIMILIFMLLGLRYLYARSKGNQVKIELSTHKDPIPPMPSSRTGGVI
ncbi:unnamed protein product, partial [Acanthoscelides obtectus]